MNKFSDIQFCSGLNANLLNNYAIDVKFGLRFLLASSHLQAPILVKNLSLFRDGLIVAIEVKTPAGDITSYRIRVSRNSNTISPYYSMLPPGWDGTRQPAKTDWPIA